MAKIPDKGQDVGIRLAKTCRNCQRQFLPGRVKTYEKSTHTVLNWQLLFETGQ